MMPDDKELKHALDTFASAARQLPEETTIKRKISIFKDDKHIFGLQEQDKEYIHICPYNVKVNVTF